MDYFTALDEVIDAATTFLALADSPILPGYSPDGRQARLREALGIVEAAR